MGITSYIAAGCLLMLTCLGGCSAGGFQGSDNAPDQGSTPNALLKRVNGVASKGIIQGGKVSIFALNTNGSVGPLLKTTGTNAFGIYSSSVNLTGPALVKVSGDYTDEATGLAASVSPEAPLRAAVDTVSSTMTIAVTPLTELAVLKTMSMLLGLVGGNIATANKLVSDIFKVDIIATLPLEPTRELFDFPLTRQEQKDYTLALAAISQMAKDDYSGSVSNALSAMSYDLAKGATLGAVTSGQFNAALRTFLQSDKNHTGVMDISATNLTNAGGGTKQIKLATSGTLEQGTSIYGVNVTIALPPGVTVRISSFVNHEADSRAVYASGVFPSGTYTGGYFVPASGSEPAYLTVSVPQGAATGSPPGEFLTVVCDLPVGATYSAEDFSVTNSVVTGGDATNLNELPNVTVKIL